MVEEGGDMSMQEADTAAAEAISGGSAGWEDRAPAVRGVAEHAEEVLSEDAPEMVRLGRARDRGVYGVAG